MRRSIEQHVTATQSFPMHLSTKRASRAAILCLALLAACGSAPEAPQAPVERDARIDWWREARFGLFIHWGLYAVPAGEWQDATNHGEWIQTTANIEVPVYENFLADFNPVEFDAERWVQLAKRAGMKYIVITTKHHDGFALFDSEVSDYDVMATPFARDIMSELADACRREGLRICWYHSIMDWHHPDYLPRRAWEQRSAEGADFERYVPYLHGQVRELLTNYGDIGVMWFDGEWERSWNHDYGQPLYDLCRELQPAVLVNNRVDVGRGGMAGMTTDSKYAGDFGTPEQEIPATGMPGVDWETCMTMNGHWGYNKADDNWKSGEELVRKLVDIASKGGNFLLNVGPRADGTFPPACVDRLEFIGRWMDVHEEAIRDTSASPFSALDFGRCTTSFDGQRTTLYLHIFDWPEDGRLVVPGVGNEALGARLLGAEELSLERVGADLVVDLSQATRDPVVPVVALELEGRAIVYEAPVIEALADQFVRPLRVTLRTHSPDLVVRFTLDGSDPDGSSAAYGDALTLTDSTTIKACAFHRGEAVSSVVERRFERATPWPASPAAERQPGLMRSFYRGIFDLLPDFEKSASESTSVVAGPTLSGEREEHIALTFDGFLRVEHDDVYLFGLDSDDGSRLWIDEQLVIDNDGLHGPRELLGHAALAAGEHVLRVEYFNQTGGAELALRWAALGEDLQVIADTHLSHTSDD